MERTKTCLGDFYTPNKSSSIKRLRKKFKYNINFKCIPDVKLYIKVDTLEFVSSLMVSLRESELDLSEYEERLNKILDNPDEIMNDENEDLIYYFCDKRILIKNGAVYERFSYLDLRCNVQISHHIITTSYEECIKVCKKLKVKITAPLVRTIKELFKRDILIYF